jgi:hypothetical protein
MKVIDSRIELLSWYQRMGFVVTDDREPFEFAYAELKSGPITFVLLKRPL